MSYLRRSSSLSLGLALAAFPLTIAGAAPPDRDYETIAPAPRPVRPGPAAAGNPPDFAASPLVIADHPAGPLPRMRFVLRDGSVMVGQILGSDGRMYALRLAHGTALVRRDFFTAITPVPAGSPHKPPARTTRAEQGARF